MNSESIPLTSIIIPTYNCAKYVCDSINSALRQIHPNIEIIVVDDGSNDDTSKILEKYNNKIRYIYQPNKGLPAARNAGLRVAQGDYIQFLDADDLILPEKIELQIESFQNLSSEYSVVYSDTSFFNENSQHILIDRDLYHFSGHIIDKLIWSNFIPVHSALIRKDCLDKVGGFNETLLHCEDYELWLRISYEGYQFYYLDKVLALYRKRKGAMTADYAKQHEYTIKAYESAYNFLDNKKLRLNLQIVKLLVYLDYLLIKIGYTQQGIIACLTSDIIFLWKTPGSLFRKLVGRFLRFFHNLHRIA